ncbi:S8 family serine peptidase [Shimia abyssi]|uniref:Subtilisin n=1 Tax=Shimia abyssi TaxID=1662395 RepID=A0A2P8FBM2_9RHOB|nr:S8 family serine peptidase [Shimia abyssi]PSL19136.1 subtilisin [Shimia abyssi]
MSETQRYILLPQQGIRAMDAATRAALTELPAASSTGAILETTYAPAGGASVAVIDSISDDGAKLVDMSNEAAELTNASPAPVRAVPVVYYDNPDPQPLFLDTSSITEAHALVSIEIKCSDASTGAGVSGARVVAFTDFEARTGASGTTGADGTVRLNLPDIGIERLYIFPPDGYWGAFRRALSTGSDHHLTVHPIDLSVPDVVRHYYGNSRFNRLAGVTAGVIDTGVGPHDHLNIIGGRNTVTGEPADEWQDGGTHGTHVAGLIGANGDAPAGLFGVAPGIGMHAYRVFGANARGASNYAILKAMIIAGLDGCDIINLSLGGGPADNIVFEAVQDAREQGMLVVVAAGNNGRRRVEFPAAYEGAIAVSAMGREGTFPHGALEEADILRPPASPNDPAEFLAAFSNVGPEISITGPGVGTLSTLPGNRYGPKSGTSMAAPAVAGAAASLLSQDNFIFNMPRDRSRANAIARLLQTSCVQRGFGLPFEGFGLPDPTLV